MFGIQVKASCISKGICIFVELSLYLIKLQTNNSVYFLTSLHEYNRRKSIKVVLLHQSKVIYNTRQTKKIEIFSLYSLDFEKEIRKDGLISITIITSTSIFTNSTPVYLAAKSSSFGSRNLHGSHHLAVNSITSYT